jgi:hypothetical protein
MTSRLVATVIPSLLTTAGSGAEDARGRPVPGVDVAPGWGANGVRWRTGRSLEVSACRVISGP